MKGLGLGLGLGLGSVVARPGANPTMGVAGVTFAGIDADVVTGSERGIEAVWRERNTAKGTAVCADFVSRV